MCERDKDTTTLVLLLRRNEYKRRRRIWKRYNKDAVVPSKIAKRSPIPLL